MAFTKETVNTPIAIADISIQLMYPEPNSGQEAGATYSVQVRYSDLSIVVRQGGLVPHISQAEITALLNFMASLRAKAITEFLP